MMSAVHTVNILHATNEIHGISVSCLCTFSAWDYWW